MATGNRPSNDPADGASMRLLGQALSLGGELAGPPLIGWWLDTWFGSAPTGVLIGAALGFTLALVHAFRLSASGPPPRPPEEKPGS